MIIGLHLTFGEQVVEDNVGAPLPNPSRFILAAAMLQIEHGKALLGLRFVTRWQINHRVSPTACHFRVVPNLAHLTVRHILNRVISRTWFWNFNGAGVLAAAKKGLTARVAYVRAINYEVVIMQDREPAEAS